MTLEQDNSLEGKSIVVYGATSKLAQAFVETALARGASIVASARTLAKLPHTITAHDRVALTKGDVVKQHDVDNAVEVGYQRFQGVDATVNFASVFHQSSRKIEESRPTNVLGERHVLETTQVYNVPRHVYISSIAAMMREGTNAYAVTKREAEEEVNKSGVTSVILRPANVIGTSDPNDIWNKPLLPILGMPKVPLRKNGRFPYTTVETVTKATIAALDRGEGHIIPVIDGYKTMSEYVPEANFLPPWVYTIVLGGLGILSKETRHFISDPPDIDLDAASRHLHVK